MGENLQEGRKQGIKSFFQLLQGGALPLPQTHLADLLGKQGGGQGPGFLQTGAYAGVNQGP